MIEFLDGPAKGKVLMLRRAPLFLRAVKDGRKAWDALDLLDDKPRPGEAVHVYRRVGEARRYHVLMRPRSQSGWRVDADYRHLPEQPPAGVLTDTDKWRAWCLAEQARGRA